jgi:hypothetical protein
LIRHGYAVIRLTAMACACLLLVACAFNVNKVQVDTARLDTGKSIGTLQCRYGLAGVVDVRPSGDRAGGLGENMLLLEDPSELISARLQSAGMIRGSAPDAPEVLVEIKRFYLTVNTMAKVPVVVLQARIDQQQPFLVRAQPVSANWNGTENEAYAALANAVQEAATQLVTELNRKCGSV